MNQIAQLENAQDAADQIEHKIRSLLDEMTLAEKIGQMRQIDATGDVVAMEVADAVRSGKVGSVINQTNPENVNALQRIAVEENRLGIPLLIARDVIHGFKTVMPIPLGQAAAWNPDLVREGARVAALEAARAGINWTFAPMIDVSRDPRWGRIAESFGEDPYLTGALGVAMVEGLQNNDQSLDGSIAACVKHFAGYGAAECGRDYNTTNIPENELRNIYLPPFKAALDAGAMTLMSSFSDIDGVPATANSFLMRDILRDEWGFKGVTVSDWNSISQLSVHGITADDKESAEQAALAGIDMEMAGDAYDSHLAELVAEGKVRIEDIDQMVANILRAKARLGLFDNPYTQTEKYPPYGNDRALDVAKKSALESIVLLRNEDRALPLDRDALKSIAVIGPMADAPYEQLGTWVFDGDAQRSITPLQAIRNEVGDDVTVRHAQAMTSTRSRDTSLFDEAIDAARQSDVTLVFLGEEAILSGEAHSRADISLPGNQAELLEALKKTGAPIIAVILAGRPLTLGEIINQTEAIMFAWHPGTMGGPAISDLLFGKTAPSGKLPVTFPKMVGQIPIYYNHKNTGRPPQPDTIIHIDDIEVGTPQTSLGMTAFHLDAGYAPQFPFGFGLSYTEFQYDELTLSDTKLSPAKPLSVRVSVHNRGAVDAAEVVQLYVRDLVGSVTRPVRELKAFKKIFLRAGKSQIVTFELTTDDLAFFRRNGVYGAEPGKFYVWVGGDSECELRSEFSIVESH
jgi:beta-glucosidase